MARDLKLQVILDAVDKATGPLKKITQGSGKTAEALKASKEQLRALEKQQKDVRGYREARAAMRKNTRALSALQGKSETYTKELNEQRERHVNLKANLKSAQRQYDKLAKAVAGATEPSQQLSHEFEKARIRLGSQQQAFEKSSRSIKKYRDQIRDTEQRTDKLTQAQRSQQDRLDRLKQKLDEAGVGTDNLGRKSRELRQNEERLTSTLEKQKAELSAITAQQKRLTAARDRYHRSIGRANNMTGAGFTAAATGGAALYGAANVLQPGIDYGETMSKVQALTRLQADDPRLAALKQQSRDLGASTAFSASQVGQGQAFLAMAGFTPEAIRQAIPDMLNMALANGLDLGRTADIGSNILSGFGLDPSQMGRVADVLTATTTRANVDLEMLGESMKYVAPQARQMGLSLEQAAAMAGLLGNVGIQGSQAGTTLRAMMTRLAAPTGAAAGALKELGVNAKDADGNLRDVPKILADVAKSMQTMGSADQASYLKAIFGEEPGAGMAELIAQQGAAGVEKFVGILGNAAGESGRVAKTMADNIAGDLKGLKSAWDEVGISITDTNKGPLRELIQNVTAITRGIVNWIKANPELAGLLAKVAAVIAAVVAAGGTLTIMLTSILGPIAAVRYALTLLSLNPASLTIMAIVAAVVALAGIAYLVYKNWGAISGWFADRWQQVKDAFHEGVGGVARLLLNWNPIALIYRGITAGLSALGIEVPDKFKTLGGAIVDGLLGGLTAKLGALKDSITGMASSVKNWFANVLGINSPSRVFMEFGGWTVEGLISGLTAKLAALKDKVVGIASSVASWFKDKLDINSPSRVFTKLGGYTVDGLNVGLDAQRDEPAKRVAEIAKRVQRAGAGMALGAAALPAAAMPGITQQEPIRFDTRPPIAAGAGQQAIDNRVTIGDIHVQAAPGMDERQLAQYVAQEVQRALAQAQHDANARRRSSLRDID